MPSPISETADKADKAVTPVRDGGIHIRSSYFGGPPFWQSSVPVTEGAANPRLACDWLGRVWLTFEKEGHAWRAVSGDLGKTFTEPVIVIAGGGKPTICSLFDGTLVFAAIVSGVLHARVWHPGRQAVGAEFTVKKFEGGTTSDFAVEDDSFHLEQEVQPHARLWLHVTKAGDADTSAWWSSDSGATWTRGAS